MKIKICPYLMWISLDRRRVLTNALVTATIRDEASIGTYQKMISLFYRMMCFKYDPCDNVKPLLYLSMGIRLKVNGFQ